jgi:anti-sigma B factor antagonist
MITVDRRDRIDIISFTTDRINALVSDEIREEIARVIINGSTKVIINLKDVRYIDSTGFGSLLSLSKTARNNFCTLKFASPEPGVMEVFKTLNLHTVFDIHSDLEKCVSSLR